MKGKLLYDITDCVGIKDCMDRNGVVGITNILTDNEIENAINDIENIIKSNYGKDFSLKDSSTYGSINKDFNGHGVIGKLPLFSKQLMETRLNPNIRKAFEIVYGDKVGQLLCQYDHASFMRSTIGTNYEDLSQFRTSFSKPGLHLDMDAPSYFEKGFEKIVLSCLNKLNYENERDFINENNFKHIALGKRYHGVLNLLDNNELDGHNKLENWFLIAKQHLGKPDPNGRYIFKEQNSCDEIFFDTTRITCPSGTLIIFDSCLPHGTKPNYSQNNRLVEFISYIPKYLFNTKTYADRNKKLKKIFNEINFQLSPENEKYI